MFWTVLLILVIAGGLVAFMRGRRRHAEQRRGATGIEATGGRQ
jgi:hypothetical protein